MLSFKRALILSALVLTIFFFTSSRRSEGSLDLKSHIRGGARPKIEEDVVVPEASANKSEEPTEMLVTQGATTTPRKNNRPRPSNMKEQPLREQLAFQFPYDVSNKFPAFIWQTWKYTVANPRFRDAYRPLEASWTTHHPDFIHEVITDQVALHLIKHLYGSVPQVLEAFTALPSAILKADFFRYLILLARGGIYSDIDTAALKPATHWIPQNFRMSSIGLVIGIEADPDRPDWAQWYSRRIQFCQWTIQSKPGHPVLREVVARITEKTLAMKRKGKLRMDRNGVIEFTGPAAWTDTVFAYFNDETYFKTDKNSLVDWRNFTGMKQPRKLGDVVVLPITSFSPGVGQFGAGEDDDPQAFVKHLFEGTWKPETERHIGENADDKKVRLKAEADERERLRKLGIYST
ncbi:membrane-bound alpha-1,6- mannosyltransferase Initiation-specific [Orbilia brochopaga]|uniref:Membrane-bound alpha-1,6- mannosyltransferase Initiation-specific n=1 Tax=Orbilia brochopaga TaxID=3140254 RepID=A0AAV9VDF4_9PEZI